jgi:hypothetical protein
VGSVGVRAEVVAFESTAGSSALLAAWRGCEGVGMTTLEPGFAAVLAVGIAKCGFEDLGLAAGAQRLHDNEG